MEGRPPMSKIEVSYYVLFCSSDLGLNAQSDDLIYELGITF